MRILGLGTSVPPQRLTQEESLDYILKNFSVKDRTRALYRKVMGGDAIKTRHFGLDPVSEILEKDHDKINDRYSRWARKLSEESLRSALGEAGLSPQDLDFVAVTTCTGYLCPGLSSYLAEALSLRPEARRADLVGMGCSAALPGLEAASDFLAAHPGSKAAVVSTEICTAAMYSGDSPDLVISNAIFADGSAAAVLGDSPGPGAVFRRFRSVHVPEWREAIRFKTEEGYLRNVLTKEVPAHAALALKDLVAALLKDAGRRSPEIQHWLFHAGGKTVLDAVQESLALDSSRLESSRAVLRDFGNMSSPTILFVLKEAIKTQAPKKGDFAVLASFGAGFSAHASLLEWT